MIFNGMPSTLRQLVRETLLAERRMQPIGAEHLVKRLNVEFGKILNSPAVLKQMRNDAIASIGEKGDHTAIDEIVALKIKENSDPVGSHIDDAGYINVIIRVDRILADGPFMDSFEKNVAEMFKTTVGNYGWSIQSLSRSWHSRWMMYVIERNYGDQQLNMSKKIYHLARSQDVKKILKMGLIPKRPLQLGNHDEDSEHLEVGRQYAPRVYVTTSRKLGKELVSLFSEAGGYKGSDNMEHYTLLKIKGRKLLHGTKFYADAEFVYSDKWNDRSFWTYSRIPPEAISIDKKWLAEYQEFMSRDDDDDPSWP
jgi:hypothetical protein